MMTAQEIHAKRFEKAAWGYQSEAVDAFFAELETTFNEIEAEREENNHKIQLLADKVREYMKDEEALKDAMLGAQKEGHRVRREAKEKADQIIERAKEEAAMLLDEATRQHEIAMKKNREEIARQEEALEQAKKMVADFKRSLFDMYKDHLEKISAIPEEHEVLPPPSAEFADIEPDEAKDAMLASMMSEQGVELEKKPVFTPPSPEDFQ